MQKLWAIVLAAGLIGAFSVQATEFSSLEERMSQPEYHAAGLDKLSAEELKSLNEWLRVHGLTPDAPVAAGRHGKNPEFYPDEDDRTPVESRMVGHFSGWMGKTKFALENGQVWQQSESGLFTDVGLDQPSVKIKPMLMGSWLMTVDGCSCNLRVKRVK